jgi:hypothetical protein
MISSGVGMKEKDLTNWQAIGIGCLVAIAASLFVLSFSVYFLPFAQRFIAFVFPVSIFGALVGKSMSSFRAWLGSLFFAVVFVVVEFFFVFSVAFLYPLD